MLFEDPLYTVSCAHDGCWEQWHERGYDVLVVYRHMEAAGWVCLADPDVAASKWALCPTHAAEAF